VAATAPVERELTLDVLRAAALFGVLLVNMEVHRGPSLYTSQTSAAEPGRGGLDDAAAFVIAWLGQGKAYTVLAFLFGYGAQVMARRATAAGGAIEPAYRRRLAGLFVLGVLHTILLFWGDVLVLYAVCGIALLLAFGARDLNVLLWSGSLLVFLLLVIGSFAFAVPALTAAEEADLAASAREAVAAYQGSIATTIEQHLRDWAAGSFGLIVALPQTIAVFLAGLWAARHHALEDLARHGATWRRIAVLGLAAGLPINLAAALAVAEGVPADPIVFGLATVGAIVAPLVLAAGYLGLVVLTARRLAILAPLGRVSLTAYLVQSAVMAVVFTSYGLELYGEVGAAAGLVITLVVFAAEVALAHLWLRRHTTGPVERLLRAWTYRR
jgi:uncharacterized protein